MVLKYLAGLFISVAMCCAQTAVFPNAVVDNGTLLKVSNRAQTTLAGTLTSGGTTINVISTTSFPGSLSTTNSTAVVIDSEVIKICGSTSNTFTVCTSGRGFDGTAAASHNSGAIVNGYLISVHHNQMAAEVTALETSLGANLINTHVITDAGPNWASYSNIYDSYRVSTGGFPITGEFGSNTVSVAQAIVGGIKIPVSDTNGNHGAGVAGYANTLSTLKGAVGLFGGGTIGVANGQAWGFNTITSNCGTPQCDNPTGFDAGFLYGGELDFNITKKPGNVTPTAPVYGLYFTGQTNTTVTSHVIHVGLMGIAAGIGFQKGFVTEDGALTVSGIELGTVGIGNSQGCQPIQLHSRDGAGVYKTSTVTCDLYGNMQLSPGTGGLIGLVNSGGTGLLNIGPTAVTVVGSAPFLFGTTTFVNLATNVGAAMYLQCTDCKGTQDAVTAGASCVSGGTGALVRKTGSAYQCF
jgi:hypothetical protein